jgi:hypothetical protein
VVDLPAGSGHLRAAIVTVAVTAAACASTPAPVDNPVEAFRAFQAAIHSPDREQLWRALDEETRAQWRLAWRARRAGRELLSTFAAEDVAADPDLRALAPSPPRPEDLFAASVNDGDLRRIAEDINPAATLLGLENEASFPTKMGDHLPFRKGPERSWGFAGFVDRAQQAARAEIETLDRVLRLVRMRHLHE